MTQRAIGKPVLFLLPYGRMQFIVGVLALCLLAVGCSSAPRSAVNPNLTLQEDQDQLLRLAEEEQKILDESGLLYRDQALEEYLNEIVRRLQAAEISAKTPIQVIVVEDPYLNAFALPNGVIYVHTGILARMDNEAQLAILLAHEMTHCTRRHALRVYQRLKNKPAFLAAVRDTLNQWGKLGALASLLGSTGLTPGFTQDLENEADRVGLELASAAGYDSCEALKLFAHLKEELETENLKEPFLFGTHPKLAKRLKYYQAFCENHFQEDADKITNTEVFLAKIHPLILDNAWLDLKRGRFRSAQRGAERYLAIQADDGRAYYLLGEVFRQRGKDNDLQKAKIYYQQAISRDPAYAEPYRAMGLIYYKEGQKRLARPFFESCLSLAPNISDKAYIEGYLRKCTPHEGG
ncbi:MAG: M48 family metalloprotease [Desulfobacterales bacterium]|nr:MAG: M48 family metalloprotease [Desulfobacterales bacterium]